MCTAAEARISVGSSRYAAARSSSTVKKSSRRRSSSGVRNSGAGCRRVAICVAASPFVFWRSEASDGRA